METGAPSIGYALKRAQSLLHLRMEESLRPFGLTVSQYSCLFRLRAEPGISASGLARSTFVTRQSMNTMLQQLSARGLVSRPGQPESGRALPTLLTATGDQLLAQAQQVVDAVEQRMIADLSSAERGALSRALDACASALEA